MSDTEDLPHFLLVQIPADVDPLPYFEVVASLVAGPTARILALQTAENVETLEVGSPAASVLLLEFLGRAALDDFWQQPAQRAAFEGIPGQMPLVLAAPGLPAEGLPEMLEIPSRASVTPPQGRGPRAYMVIQGSSSDETRMDQYRDIILPMVKEQGAYYIAFEIDGKTEVLAGQWPYDLYVVSRWPDHAAGYAFWYSDRYQNTAIPVRTGAGSFWVHFMRGEAG